MKETISIKNFGGLKDVTIPLNSINIFIGKQASGKSVTAKLIYFFKQIIQEILYGSIQEKSKKEIDAKLLEIFATYFPQEVWADHSFNIEYEFGSETIAIKKTEKGQLKLSYGSKIKNLFQFTLDLEKKRKETQETKQMLLPLNDLFFHYYFHVEETLGDRSAYDQIFVPAARSFFTNIQRNIFSLLSTNQTIDPFLIKFGSVYENMKQTYSFNLNKGEKAKLISESVDKLISEILVGKYQQENKKDYIVHNDNRKINISFSSSGQQEALPLLVLLSSLARGFSSRNGATIYIEEPEAHLFPLAQKKIVELISTIYNNAGTSLQFIITTHSPYILTSFNNLLQAGQLLGNGVNKKKLFKIVPEFEILKCGELNAYAFQDGDVVNLIDEETGLISADLLDRVSEEIAIQFDELLELQ